MVAMEDVTEEEEVVDKVTKMAAEFIFSVDAHISLMHSSGKPYMQKTCDVAEKALLAKKNLRKKCVNRDKM